MNNAINYFIILVLVFTGILSAQPQKLADNPKRESGFFKMLNLTPEQERQFKDIRYEQQKKAIDLRSQIQKNRLEIKHMVNNNNIDEKKILSLTDETSKIQAELRNSSVKSWLAIHKFLTSEQQEIWTKHFQGMRSEMRDSFKNRTNKRFNKRGEMRMKRFEDRDPVGMIEFKNDEEMFGMFEPEEIEPRLEPGI